MPKRANASSETNKGGRNKAATGLDLSTTAFETHRQRLMVLFSLVTALTIAATGYLIGQKLFNAVSEQMADAYIMTTATQLVLFTHMGTFDESPKTPFTGKKYEEFEKYLNMVIEDSHIKKVKLWSRDGTVLFATDRQLIGKTFSGKNNLKAALKGEPAYDIMDLNQALDQKNDDHIEDKKDFDQIIEVYYPWKSEGSAKIEMVFEAYISIEPLQAKLNAVKRVLYSTLIPLTIVLIALVEFISIALRKRNAQLNDLSRKLAVKADTDGLTGLYNHRHFQNYLEQQLKIAERYDQEAALMLIDLDFFKTVNDRFGHQAGDHVLRTVGQVLREFFRDSDYLARYGGEEFVVLLPETNASAGLKLAERLRKKIETFNFDAGTVKATTFRLTLSCGIAAFPDCANNRESLIAAADAALLCAKRTGRNRVSSFQELSDVSLKENDIESLIHRLQHAALPTIQALVAANDTEGDYEHAHAPRMSTLALEFGARIGLSGKLLNTLNFAIQVHDVKKMAIPECTRLKTKALTNEEIQTIRSHPEVSARILETASETETLISAVLHHHENWDGTGYPGKLKGNKIPYLARVLRIVDSFVAMTSDRPYRPALSEERVLQEFKDNAGKQLSVRSIRIIFR